MHTTGYKYNTISVMPTKTPPTSDEFQPILQILLQCQSYQKLKISYKLTLFSTKLRSNLKLKPSHLCL